MPVNASVMNLLRILSSGEYVSGEQLGDLLGVSRAAIWKQLQSVEALGLMVERTKGRGYRLPVPLNLLNKQSIVSKFDPVSANLVRDVLVEVEVGSTNKVLSDLCSNNQSIHGVAVVAERQLAGRGRRGRDWHSPFAANIYLSFGWTFYQGMAAIEGLSLAVGVAVCEVLSGFGSLPVKLKWPNDILVDNKKLGGVLIELTGDPSGECHVIIGLGLNVAMPRSIAGNIDQPWVDLHSLGVMVDRNMLIASLVSALACLLGDYEVRRFAAYQNAWESLNAHNHCSVSVSTPQQTVTGIMLGVTDTGALRLSVDGVEKIFLGGEVSLRVSV